MSVFGECIEGSFLILVSVYTGCPFGGTRNIYPTPHTHMVVFNIRGYLLGSL